MITETMAQKDADNAIPRLTLVIQTQTPVFVQNQTPVFVLFHSKHGLGSGPRTGASAHLRVHDHGSMTMTSIGKI